MNLDAGHLLGHRRPDVVAERKRRDTDQHERSRQPIARYAAVQHVERRYRAVAHCGAKSRAGRYRRPRWGSSDRPHRRWSTASLAVMTRTAGRAQRHAPHLERECRHERPVDVRDEWHPANDPFASRPPRSGPSPTPHRSASRGWTARRGTSSRCPARVGPHPAVRWHRGRTSAERVSARSDGPGAPASTTTTGATLNALASSASFDGSAAICSSSSGSIPSCASARSGESGSDSGITMSMPIAAGLYALIECTSRASNVRGHGQRPRCDRLFSSIWTIVTGVVSTTRGVRRWNASNHASCNGISRGRSSAIAIAIAIRIAAPIRRTLAVRSAGVSGGDAGHNVSSSPS